MTKRGTALERRHLPRGEQAGFVLRPGARHRAGAAGSWLCEQGRGDDVADTAPARRHLLQAAGGLALGGMVSLAGCGFQLRQPVVLPFRRLALVGFGPASAMAQALRNAAGTAVEWPAVPAQADVQLVALVDRREKAVSAYTAARRVSEFQLRVRLRFQAQTPAGRVLLPDSELVLTRELSYSETQALGKEFEEARLYADMEADIAQQVMRRLATARP